MVQVCAFVAVLCVICVLRSTWGQSDFLCPPNNKMGLCEDVADPCFDNSDCSADTICCPEACSRVCKPKMAPGQSSQGMAEVPDLLNDPRVYVGKCPDSSCFSLFSAEPDQCSTSRLCRPEQFCCHDGCKNVCRWKPPYAQIIAKHEARVRVQQQILYQKQQAKLKKRQEAERREQQRKMAEMEQARRAARAKAEASAVLAAQRAKAEYEAKVKAASAAHAQATSKLQQQMAQQQAAALLQQQQQQQQQQRQTSNTNTYNNNNNNAVLTPPLSSPTATTTNSKQSGRDITLGGFFNALKRDKLAGTLTNQIDSPANHNPYTAVGGAMGGANALDKRGYPTPSAYTSDKTQNSGGQQNAISAALAQLIMPASSQQNQYNKPVGNVAPPLKNLAPPTRNLAPPTRKLGPPPAALTTPTFPNGVWPPRGPVIRAPQATSYQASANSGRVNNQYNPQQQQQQSVSPYLMYHFMQAA